MSDPQRRAERQAQQAQIAAVRAGTTLDEMLEQEDTIPEVEQEPQDPTPAPGQYIPVQGGGRLVSYDDFQRLRDHVERQGNRIHKLEGKVVNFSKAARKMQVGVKAFRKRYAEAFSEFHGRASEMESSGTDMLYRVARGVDAYIRGINVGERPLSPQLNALAEVLTVEDGGLLGGVSALGGALLRWMSYTNPLTSDLPANTATPASTSNGIIIR